MATRKEYLQFIPDQLSGLEDITYRGMMGEYILYYKEKIAAYLCDDRLLVKILPSTMAMLSDAPRESPYEGAREMLLVENVDDRSFLETLFLAMYPELPKARSRKRKA